MNLFKFKQSGVYKLSCLVNKKIYYGQTSDFLRRSWQHLTFLENQQHMCFELQKDFNNYDINNFEFTIVKLESNLYQRLKLEKQLINDSEKNFLYNKKTVDPNFMKLTQRVAQRVKINNTINDSISQAARHLKKSSRSIRQSLADPTKKNFERLNEYRHSMFDKYEVFIDDQFFKSTQAVVAVGLAKTTRQVRDRCKSNKWNNWVMVKKVERIV